MTQHQNTEGMPRQESVDITYRPWGNFRNLGAFGTSFLKTLHVDAGGVLSLQRHAKRSEIWILLSGDAQAVRGTDLDSLETVELEIGVPFHVPVTCIHRLSSRTGGVLSEVCIGEFDEEDIERLEDIYGRIL
jgi:mannose-6-phosphate isomerase-like protein (cupin superfamily)